MQVTGRYEIYLTSSMSSSNEYAITATKQDTTVNTDSTCFDMLDNRGAVCIVNFHRDCCTQRFK